MTLKEYNINTKPKLSLRQKIRKFINKIDIWRRANITQRAHWLRLTPNSSAYMDLDMKLEYACLALAREYLEKELGHESRFKPEQKENMKFYKGYQVYADNEEFNIDICLRVIKAKKDEEVIYTHLGRRLSSEKKKALRDELTAAMIDLVKHRGSLWT